MENINTNIGLVGLGIIGSSIFRNIQSAGYKSSGFDIDEGSMSQLNNQGYKTTESIDDLIENSNILITSLPNSKALDETFDAIIENKKSCIEVIIETSTLSLDCKLRNEKRAQNIGIAVLDCPISGTGKQAETADIVLYASGSEEAYEKALPILD
ncbi:MAG: NAD(P)-binding domain-containing protein, partial [Gammaproteobacteria bacterium]|nr:NAD(P)-binding domain-containing protein [Gammaproteobacteria bacterium]